MRMPCAILGLGALAVLGGCSVRFMSISNDPNVRAYRIACADDPALCEEKARKLCPHGFDRTDSRRLSKLDEGRGMLFGRPDTEYQLSVECHPPIQ
jgi:hypothetical protein